MSCCAAMWRHVAFYPHKVSLLVTISSSATNVGAIPIAQWILFLVVISDSVLLGALRWLCKMMAAAIFSIVTKVQVHARPKSKAAQVPSYPTHLIGKDKACVHILKS